MQPTRNKPVGRRAFLIRTIMLFLVLFVMVIAVFYLFSLMLPSVTGKCVAVVDVNYPLTTSGVPATLFSEGYPGSGQLAHTIRELNDRDDVGAIVFVINSGGGSVVASGEIYDSIEELDKPSVSYFREVAASGAYHIASATDYIISDPNAITGSLGVVTTVVSMQGLFDKIGINGTNVVSGEHKDMGSSFRNMSQQEQMILQALVDEVFDDFKSDILRNRQDRMNMPLFEEALDGRIMTGRKAETVGLVDETGNIMDAILKAAHMAGMEAESAEEVRRCPVPVLADEGAMLSADTFLSILEARAAPSISYQ
ncbi:MAG: signal peptide peptidase SppA [Candidatus Micrarchaeota archaeon]